MSNIRRQSIISSVIVYFGFALGFVNTYLYTKEGTFTEAQYGLVNIFIAIANIMFAFANLGMHSYIYKFYPYYKDNLPTRKNDLLTWALTCASFGFIIIIFIGYLIRDLVVQKYITNAPDLVTYYMWLFPFGFGLTIFSILEAYAWQERMSVVTNFLREVLFRLFSTLLIVLFFAGIIPLFSVFIKIYAGTYMLLALVLAAYLIVKGKISFTFSISRVTKKFYKKILALVSFVWGGGLVFTVAQVFDTLVIAAVVPNGLFYVGVYSLAQNIASLIQAPQRGIISAAMGPLSRAWKDKDMGKLARIYQRSSINQLIFSVGMFCILFMNFTDGIETFSMKEGYTLALPAFFFIGIMRILDMGTGLNAQIISTSTYWRFEFFTGLVLLALTMPLTYLLTKKYGVTGPAISNLITFTIYNTVRCAFLWKKTKMQPFSTKTFLAIIAGVGAYAVCYLLFAEKRGIEWIISRSLAFIALYGAAVYFLKLTPDLLHVIDSVKRRKRNRAQKE
ncbi:MAG: lipopolysaccharide biosynthesis protein [Chitinophagaceae bacterium]|nr:lipopolysaccharide biosynthesis protein [Chitinophagaceae bacterium]